jgi:type IV secretion system protein VirB10
VKDAAKEDRSYHPFKTVKALSANEIKTGSYIPMTLSQGINSDLPGQITARISEDVYDTITGCRLLIPAMSTVVGKYDSKVALGQARMLVVWNTVVFPNGDELNIAGMQGYDTGGYAGLNSDVDNHFLRLFGLTLGMSMITAAVQVAVPQQSTTGTVQSPSQILETALAQQYGQLGAQLLGKYMQIQPTLKNYPGERFMIVVPHTIVFDKVWRNRCEAKDQSED